MTHHHNPIHRVFRTLSILLAAVLLLAGGCHVPARVFWSPDGNRAVYINYEQVAVIDADGAIQFQAVGEGTAAWSADSRTAYFALSTDAVLDAPTRPTVYQTRWVDEPPAPQAEPGERLQAVVAYGPDGLSPLFVIDQPVMHLHLSPDQQWLAVLTSDAGSDGQMTLFAWHLPSKTLYLVQRKCGFATAFTGDHRLLYVKPLDPNRPPHQPGDLVEITLDPTREQPERKTLVSIQAGPAMWVQPAGDQLLVGVIWFDAREQPESDFNPNVHPIRILRYGRNAEAPQVIADWTTGLFTVSPDGRRVLFERITPRDDDAQPKRELMVMNTDGTNPRPLRDITVHGMTLPMWPNWRGNDQIAFTPAPADDDPVDPIDEQWRRTDVILYDLADDAQAPLRATKTLSTNWKLELKPRYR